jgi:hypothetical protein
MNDKPQWTGRSETFVNEAELEMAQRIKSMQDMYGLTRDENLRDQIVDLTVEYIKRFRSVDQVVPYLEGYQPGVYIIEGKRVLVTGKPEN